MTVTLPGLASGLDTNALVTSLVSSQQKPLTALQTKQRNVDQATTTVTSFSSKLASLASAARALDTSAEFNSTSASTSDTTSVVASSAGGALAGGYDVRVTQLAREQRTQSNTFASNSDTLGLSGDINISVGGASPVTVSLTSGDTLTDVAARISSSGARLNASVIYDGSRYRLMVRGLDTGASASIAFTEADPAIHAALGLSDGANTYQTAQDAQFTVDNISMTRPTNQVADAVPGVTLGLVKATASAVRVTVASDTSALKTKVQAFVSAYNDVVSASHSATGFGTQKATNTELAGDRALRGALQRISNIVASAVPGTTGRYTTLSSVGVNLQNDGTLKFSESTFNTAVNADPVAVSKLFVTDTRIGATGVMSTFNSTVDGLTGTVNAPVRARIDALSAQSRRIGTEVTDMQGRLNKYADGLRTQFASMEGQVSRYQTLLNTAAGITGINGSR